MPLFTKHWGFNTYSIQCLKTLSQVISRHLKFLFVVLKHENEGFIFCSFGLDSVNVSRKAQYKEVYKRTIEILQCARIFNVNCCLKVHKNALDRNFANDFELYRYFQTFQQQISHNRRVPYHFLPSIGPIFFVFMWLQRKFAK